jgi:hypothetical protein
MQPCSMPDLYYLHIVTNQPIEDMELYLDAEQQGSTTFYSI